MCPQDVLFRNVQGTFIPNSQTLERRQVPIKGRMDKQTEQSADGAAFSSKEAQTPTQETTWMNPKDIVVSRRYMTQDTPPDSAYVMSPCELAKLVSKKNQSCCYWEHTGWDGRGHGERAGVLVCIYARPQSRAAQCLQLLP